MPYSITTLSEKTAAHEKITWAMSSSKWHNQYVAGTILKPVSEVKPHDISCDSSCSIYLGFVFPPPSNDRKLSLNTLFSEAMQTFMVTGTGVRFRMWTWLFLWNVSRWFMSYRHSSEDWPTCTCGHVPLWKQSLTVKWCFSLRFSKLTQESVVFSNSKTN